MESIMKLSEMKYSFPEHKLKMEFTVGTYGENDWELGEVNCVDRHYYALPNGNEWAVYKFCERTRTGNKKCRWEVWYNGKWYNNYFTSYEDAIQSIDGEIEFNGFNGKRIDYRVDAF